MCWNLYRYLRADKQSFLSVDVAKGLVEIMEEDDEEEHRMFEIKRLIARLPKNDFIKVKATVGHFERLGDILADQGVRFHAALALIFAPVILRRPSRKNNIRDLHSPFLRSYRGEDDEDMSDPGLDDMGDRDASSERMSGSGMALAQGKALGISMAHMVVAGAGLMDPALDPSLWEDAATSAIATETEAPTEMPEPEAPPEIVLPDPPPEPEPPAEPPKNDSTDVTPTSSFDSVATGGSDNSMDDRPSVVAARRESKIEVVKTKRAPSSKSARPVPGYRQDFPTRDMTPLMPPAAVTPQELYSAIAGEDDGGIRDEEEDEND
ncbi:hypothetical protein HK101_007105, partial [Irineochytrium annulatum]